MVIFNDITGRRKAEEARRRLQAERDALLARLQLQIERLPLACITFDDDFRIVDWNPAAERIFGFGREDAVGRGPDLIVPADVLARSRREAAPPPCGGHVRPRRQREPDEGRPHHHLRVEQHPPPGRGRALHRVGVAGPGRDGPHRGRGGVAAAGPGDSGGDAGHPHHRPAQPDNPIIYASPGFERLTGYRAAEVVGRNCRFLQGAGSDPATVARVREAVRAARPCSVEVLNYKKDGTPFWNALSLSPVRDSGGMVTHFVGVQADVSERRRADEAVRESEQRYRELFENAVDAVYTLDLRGRFTSANTAAEALSGYSAEELAGMNVSDLLVPDELERSVGMLNSKLAGAPRTVYQTELATRDGRRRTVEIASRVVCRGGRPVGVQGVARDLTERRLLEDQLRQAQKMEAVGQLAGGVAHDFNNLLTVIQGYGGILLSSLGPDDPSRELIGEMTRAGERAAGLTRQLLTFSRQSVLAPRVLDLNAVVLDLEKMLRRVIGEDIDLSTDLQAGLGRVKADQGQIEQVLMNLAVNARDAMPTGGKLTIETRNIELDETFAGLHGGIRPGPYVFLAVSDDGCGMSPEVRARIYEPFFTTKEKGKGTGLGLATVHGIVQQTGGHIQVYSEPGLGSSFKVYLPCVEEPTSSAKSRSGILTAPRGTETVLLAEDEDALRSLGRFVLQGAGYRVLEASDGKEALAVAAQHEGPIHLLASDVVMPELGGRQLAERLRALRPEMKTLFLSGYTDDAVVRHGVMHETVHFLQKPFSPLGLARKVREVLDAPA